MHLFAHNFDHDYYFELLGEEERAAQSITRCSTAHHRLFRAGPRANRTLPLVRNLRVEETRRAAGSPRVSPLTDPTVQNYRSGFLKRSSLRPPKTARSAVATTDTAGGLPHSAPTSAVSRACGDSATSSRYGRPSDRTARDFGSSLAVRNTGSGRGVWHSGLVAVRQPDYAGTACTNRRCFSALYGAVC